MPRGTVNDEERKRYDGMGVRRRRDDRLGSRYGVKLHNERGVIY
jgi:hypothetical protein